jgi:hypothetical protein
MTFEEGLLVGGGEDRCTALPEYDSRKEKR